MDQNLAESASGQHIVGKYNAQADRGGTANVWVVEYRPPPPVSLEQLTAAEHLLAELPLDVVPAPSPLPPGSRMPLASNPLFVGREEDLRAPAKVLKGGGTVVVGQAPIAAVTGLVGIGKTQLAAEFVYRYGRFFAGRVFWLNFANPADVPKEVAACGLGGALELRSDFAGLPLAEELALVEGAWQSPLPRLLVFDNCEDPVLLNRWRPKSGGCRVLVTSRRAWWDATLGVHVLPLGYLPRDQSVALLATLLRRKKEADLPVNDPSLDAIAAELGDLPLALHLAGSVLALYHNKITPADYLAQLRGSDRFEALEVDEVESGGPSPTGHVQSVARTFTLSYRRLDPTNEHDALARALLARAAYLAPGEPIPRLLLWTTLAQSDDTPQVWRTFERALRRLVDLGLLEEPAEDAVRMHRLVVAFVRQEVPDPDAQAAVEQALMKTAIGRSGESEVSPLRAMQSHLRFVTDAAAERKDVRAAGLCRVLGAHLRMLGDYRQAQAYFEQALAFRQQVLGERHSDTVASLNDVGFVLKDQGKFSEAQPYFEQALKITRSLRGEKHPETAVSLNNLGLVYKDLGWRPKALSCFQQALKITEAQGKDHPDSVTSLHNLAWLLVDQGLRSQARLYLDRALRIQQNTFGEQDLRTVESLNSLGELLFRQGSFGDTVRDESELHNRALYPVMFEPFKEAQHYFEQALAIRQQFLGDHDPETAESLNNLARVLAGQSDTAAARRYFEQALAIQQQVLGEWHPRTAQTLTRLGRLLGSTSGGLREAKLYLEQARDIFERTFGPEHAKTIAVRSDLEHCKSQMEYWSDYYRSSVSG